MNVLTIFDQRITAIFNEGAPGSSQPFSFKRLAKRSVREMEDETFVIDGVDTAPALYTILVSPQDDALMRPLYLKITDEISQLIEAQAKKRGYTFVGRPLVRFMVDPALRSGRFSVFAENIDPRTLARLRDEENAYLGITPPQEVRSSQSFVPASVPVHEEEPMPVSQQSIFATDDKDTDTPDFLDEIDFDEPEEPIAPAVPLVNDAPIDAEDGDLDELPGFAADEDAADAADAPDPFEFIPEDYAADTAEEEVATEAGTHMAPPEPEPQAQTTHREPACSLTDLNTGQTYRITSDHTPIGRERGAGCVVLSDENASRRHAELLFDGSNWYVRDLNSTNGTLVNSIDVMEARLSDHDVLTIGLTQLEFREG